MLGNDKDKVAMVRAIPLPEYFQEVMPHIDEDLADMWVDLQDRGISRCPFHEERTPSFRWYEQTNTCYCFGCGGGGDIIHIHRKFRNVAFDEAVEYLYEHFIGEETDTRRVKRLSMDDVKSKADLAIFNHMVLERVSLQNTELAEELSLLVRLGKLTGQEAVAYYQQARRV